MFWFSLGSYKTRVLLKAASSSSSPIQVFVLHGELTPGELSFAAILSNGRRRYSFAGVSHSRQEAVMLVSFLSAGICRSNWPGRNWQAVEVMVLGDPLLINHLCFRKIKRFRWVESNSSYVQQFILDQQPLQFPSINASAGYWCDSSEKLSCLHKVTLLVRK